MKNQIRNLEDRKAKYKQRLRVAVPYFGLLLVFLLFAFTTNGKFIRLSNMKIILTQGIMIMVAGIGVTFVMAHGNLDFSIGGEMALCAFTAYFSTSLNPWLALPVSIAVGVGCSSVTAWINTSMKVPAFIAGMCIMFLGRGTAEVVTQSRSNLNTPMELLALDKSGFYITVFLIVLVTGYILMEHTEVGKYNKAIGANENAAYLSGIPVARYKRYAFMISGTCVGLCAFMTLIRSGTVNANTGAGLEINSLLAAVLGGVALTGGSNVRVQSAVIGALILYMLSNGMSLWGVNPDLVNVIKALVFFACVFMTRDTSNNTIPV